MAKRWHCPLCDHDYNIGESDRGLFRIKHLVTTHNWVWPGTWTTMDSANLRALTDYFKGTRSH